MKNDRVGEWLWEEWDGEGYEPMPSDSIIYVTYDHVDLDQDLVKRALASCMQRDGIADSLSDAFTMIEKSIVSQGYVGFLDGEKLPYVTNDFGQTEDGDYADSMSKATWVDYSD